MRRTAQWAIAKMWDQGLRMKPRMQGLRMKFCPGFAKVYRLVGQKLEHVAVIPSGFLALGAHTDLG